MACGPLLQTLNIRGPQFDGFGWLFDMRAQPSRWGNAFIREVYYREEKQRMSVAPWLECCGHRLRTAGIDCTSSKLQKTKNFYSSHCLQSHEIHV